MPRTGRLPMLAVLAAALAAAPPLEAGAEVGATGAYVAEECAADETCVEQSVTLHFAAGGRHRLRGSLSALRLRSPEGVVRTLAGSVPLRHEQWASRRHGTAGPVGGTSPGTGENGAWASGIGDVYAGLSSTLAGGGSRLFILEGELDVKLPTAREEEALGTGEWDGRLGLAGERRFWSFTVFGGAGWSRLGDPEWADLRDGPDGVAGCQSEPSGGGGWILSGWIRGRREVVEGAGPEASVSLGLRRSGAVPWQVSLGAGITRAAERLRVSFGLWWGRRTLRRGPGAGGLGT